MHTTPPRTRHSLAEELMYEVEGNPELTKAAFALIGGWVVAGSSVESAMCLALSVIREDLAEAALTDAGVTP